MSILSKSLTLLLTTTLLSSAYSSDLVPIRSSSEKTINRIKNENGTKSNQLFYTEEHKAYYIQNAGDTNAKSQINMMNNMQKQSLISIICEFKVGNESKAKKLLEKFCNTNLETIIKLKDIITCEKIKKFLKKATNFNSENNIDYIKKMQYNYNEFYKFNQKIFRNNLSPTKFDYRQILKECFDTTINSNNLQIILQTVNNNTFNIKEFVNNKIFDNFYIKREKSLNKKQLKMKESFTIPVEVKIDEDTKSSLCYKHNKFISSVNDILEKKQYKGLKDKILKSLTDEKRYQFSIDKMREDGSIEKNLISHLLNSKHICQCGVFPPSHKKTTDNDKEEKTLMGDITELPNYDLIKTIIEYTWNENQESPDIKEEYKKEVYYIIENYLVAPIVYNIFEKIDSEKYLVEFEQKNASYGMLKITNLFGYINMIVFQLKFDENNNNVINTFITIYGKDKDIYKTDAKYYAISKEYDNNIRNIIQMNKETMKDNAQYINEPLEKTREQSELLNEQQKNKQEYINLNSKVKEKIKLAIEQKNSILTEEEKELKKNMKKIDEEITKLREKISKKKKEKLGLESEEVKQLRESIQKIDEEIEKLRKEKSTQEDQKSKKESKEEKKLKKDIQEKKKDIYKNLQKLKKLKKSELTEKEKGSIKEIDENIKKLNEEISYIEYKRLELESGEVKQLRESIEKIGEKIDKLGKEKLTQEEQKSNKESKEEKELEKDIQTMNEKIETLRIEKVEEQRKLELKSKYEKSKEKRSKVKECIRQTTEEITKLAKKKRKMENTDDKIKNKLKDENIK